MPANSQYVASSLGNFSSLNQLVSLPVQLSEAFNVDYDRVSNLPTLVQAGCVYRFASEYMISINPGHFSYAAGLLLIAPLGDLVRRRPFILMLTLVACALTFGVAFTSNFVAFEAISFFIGVFSIVPQILIPLAADLAPPSRRATAISIVVSGLLLGILIARVISGLIAEFVSWRVVYYLSIGVQALVFGLLYFTLPDFPAVNKEGFTYFGILYTMGKLAVTEPLLIQASLVCFASMACFTNFWVSKSLCQSSITFLIGLSIGHAYIPPGRAALPLLDVRHIGLSYAIHLMPCSVVIGLFGLVGMFGVFMAPVVGRVVDHVVPWMATVIATIALMVFQAIQTGAGGINIAAVIIVCFGIDVFRQMQQVSLTTAVLGIDPKARSRLNSVILVSVSARDV